MLLLSQIPFSFYVGFKPRRCRTGEDNYSVSIHKNVNHSKTYLKSIWCHGEISTHIEQQSGYLDNLRMNRASLDPESLDH